MSVEIEGVKGYEYQYLATIYLSLLYIGKSNLEVYVENTEDARLIFTEEDREKEIYLQAKKHETAISIEDLCLWLTHFGERQSDEFLLSRISEENHYVVFISAGRCNDGLLQFIRNKDFHIQNNCAFQNKYLQELRKRVLTQFTGETKLEEARKMSVTAFFESINNKELKAILQKVSIAEQLTYKALLNKTLEILKTRYVISPSNVDYVVKLLDECIRTGRDTGQCIADKLKSIIDKYSQRILPDDVDYVDVPNQQIYEEVLEKEHALLLTGIPFCGKTSIAKALAQSYARQGYEVRQTNELGGDSGALSFLNNYSMDKRILLLEDSFGSVKIKSDKLECTQNIYKLITERASSTRKIIITTRLDLLLTAYGKMTIDECSIGNNHWFDQTMNNVTFAYEFWSKEYGDGIESKLYFNDIQKWLQQKNAGIFLEIGEIRNLKRLYPTIHDLRQESFEQVYNNARISSKSLMDKIKADGPDAIRAFICLGFCCNTISAVSMENLAFMLSESKETPALIKRKDHSIRCVTIGSDSPIEPSFPQYGEKHKIDSHILKSLQMFEQQGYIFRNKVANEVYFAHPIFHHTSSLLLLDELENQWDYNDIELLGMHGVSALDKKTNLCALDMLAYCIDSNCNRREAILSIILQALNSIFPATKDKAILLLDQRFDELTSEQQDKLVAAVKEHEFDQYLLWKNDEPFLNPNEDIQLAWDFSDLLGIESPIAIEDIKAIKSKQACPPRVMHNILKSTISENLPLDFLRISMTYDESIIREKAIYLIFKNHAADLQDVNSFLNDFDNANVTFELFRGALKAWSCYKQDDKNQILRYFVRNLQRCSVSIQSKDFLETFGDDYHSKSLDWNSYSPELSIELWNIWGIVFAEFFRSIPPKYLRMDEPHMERTVDLAVKYINNPRILVELFIAWNKWLSSCQCPTDYGMCLMEKVLNYIPASSPERETLFTEMLAAHDSSIITSHIKHIVDNWDSTIPREKELFFSLLQSERNDILWLKAVALTRRFVPEAVQYCVCKEDLLSKDAKEIVKKLRTEHLLEPCLNIHCGYPQPLWWNGYHHSNCELWDAIISEVLREDILDQSYEISLREFVDNEYNYDDRFERTRGLIWDNILSTKQKRDRTFSWLLQISCSHNQTNRDIWDKYFRACDISEKAAAYHGIADHIEALEYQNAPDGILNLFDQDEIFEFIYPLLEYDKLIKDFCNCIIAMGATEFNGEIIGRSLQEKISSTFISTIQTLYDKTPPRMQLTNEIVLRTTKRINLTDKRINNILEERRLQLIDIACKDKHALDDQYDLSNWN